MDEQIERRSPMHEHPQSQASDDEISQMLSRLNDPIPRIRAGNAFTLGERHVEAAVQPQERIGRLRYRKRPFSGGAEKGRTGYGHDPG